MNAIGAYWEAIGRGIAEGLRGVASVEHALPEIAGGVLARQAAPKMNATDIADWMLAAGGLPRQVNFHSGFGEPPLIVFERPEFFIEVLFWFPSPTAIHGHAFTGAFVVLDGFSIQVEYDFHEHSAPEEAVRLGRLEPRTLEFIGPGKVCPILPDARFIHTVTHLGNPSLTLVARTPSRPDDRQFRFHRCGFAVWSRPPRESIVRQTQVLLAVRSGDPGGFRPRLTRLLESVNDRDFYGVNETLLANLGPTPFAQEILPLLAEFAPRRPDVVAALRERSRTRSLWLAARASLNPRDLVRCALADLLPDAAERDALLCRSYGIDDPAQLPERWRDLVVGSAARAPSA